MARQATSSVLIALIAAVEFLVLAGPANCGAHPAGLEAHWREQVAADRALCAPYGLPALPIKTVSAMTAVSSVLDLDLGLNDPPKQVLCRLDSGRSRYYEHTGGGGSEGTLVNICELQPESDTRYQVKEDTVVAVARFAHAAVRSIAADSRGAPAFYAPEDTGGPSSLSVELASYTTRLRVIGAQAQRVNGRLHHLLVLLEGTGFHRWRVWEHPSGELELVMAKAAAGPGAVDIGLDDPDDSTISQSAEFYKHRTSSGYLQDRERDKTDGTGNDEESDHHHVTVGEVLLEEHVAAWKKEGLPESFDIRAPPASHAGWQECLLPKKRQGDCGSCYALASARAFGERLCIRTRGRVRMWPSVQQQKDCSQMYKDPCEGGHVYPDAVASMSNVGAIPESYFPYSVPRFYQSSKRCSASNAWELRFNRPTKDATPKPLTFRNVDPTRYSVLIDFSKERYSVAMKKMLKSIYSYGPVVWMGMWKNHGLASHAVTVLGWRGLATGSRIQLIVRNSNAGRWSDGYEFLMHDNGERNMPLRWPQQIASFIPDVPVSPAEWPYTLERDEAMVNEIDGSPLLSLTLRWAAPEHHSENDWAMLMDERGEQVGPKVSLGVTDKEGSITFEGLPRPSQAEHVYTAYLYASVKNSHSKDDLLFKSQIVVHADGSAGNRASARFLWPENGWGGDWSDYSHFPSAFDHGRGGYMALTPEVDYEDMITYSAIPSGYASLDEYYQAAAASKEK